MEFLDSVKRIKRIKRKKKKKKEISHNKHRPQIYDIPKLYLSLMCCGGSSDNTGPELSAEVRRSGRAAFIVDDKLQKENQ